MTKDIAKSIKAKLLNIAKQDGLDYQLLIIRYLYERLLYRLSVSDYRDKFNGISFDISTINTEDITEGRESTIGYMDTHTAI